MPLNNWTCTKDIWPKDLAIEIGIRVCEATARGLCCRWHASINAPLSGRFAGLHVRHAGGTPARPGGARCNGYT